VRLREFATAPSAIPENDLLRLTALAELFMNQSETAGANATMDLDAFLQHAKNMGMNNISDDSFITASTQTPLSNVIKTVDKDVIYFRGADEPESTEVATASGPAPTDNKAIVSKMANRVARQATK
jgi:uncharacterized protein YfdQ (DUF2303 family)